MSNNQINFIGWILFILSALGFIIASIGNFWGMVGSIFFLVACFVFLIPFLSLKNDHFPRSWPHRSALLGRA